MQISKKVRSLLPKTKQTETKQNNNQKKNKTREEPEAERNQAGSPRDGRRTRLAAAGFKPRLLTPENLQKTSRVAVPRFHQFPPVEAGGNTCRDSGRCQLGVAAGGGAELPAASPPTWRQTNTGRGGVVGGETPCRSQHASCDQCQQVRLSLQTGLHGVDQVWTLAVDVQRT